MFSVVSVTRGQPWPKNIKRKILEINNSEVLQCELLSCMMKSHAILLSLAWDMNQPFFHHIHAVYAVCLLSVSSGLGYQINGGIPILMFK